MSLDGGYNRIVFEDGQFRIKRIPVTPRFSEPIFVVPADIKNWKQYREDRDFFENWLAEEKKKGMTNFKISWDTTRRFPRVNSLKDAFAEIREFLESPRKEVEAPF